MQPDKNFKSIFDYDVPYVENPYPRMRRERLERDARFANVCCAVLIATVVLASCVELIRALAV